MSEDFGLLNLVISPIRERIAQEDRLNGDPPHKQKSSKPKPIRKPEDGAAPDESEAAEDFMSSNHIDLRI